MTPPTPPDTHMNEREFQRSISADMNTIVRLQREREQTEVCWICQGKGHDMYMEKCVYCNGLGKYHVERKT